MPPPLNMIILGLTISGRCIIKEKTSREKTSTHNFWKTEFDKIWHKMQIILDFTQIFTIRRLKYGTSISTRVAVACCDLQIL